jgi:hypothetical protein
MPRFTSATSNVTVSVDDATAALLGSEWEPADDKKSTGTHAKKSDS